MDIGSKESAIFSQTSINVIYLYSPQPPYSPFSPRHPNGSFITIWYSWQIWHNHFVAIGIANDQKNVLHIDRDYKWCFGYCCKFNFHLYSFSIDQINSVVAFVHILILLEICHYFCVDHMMNRVKWNFQTTNKMQ